MKNKRPHYRYSSKTNWKVVDGDTSIPLIHILGRSLPWHGSYVRNILARFIEGCNVVKYRTKIFHEYIMYIRLNICKHVNIRVTGYQEILFQIYFNYVISFLYVDKSIFRNVETHDVDMTILDFKYYFIANTDI